MEIQCNSKCLILIDIYRKIVTTAATLLFRLAADNFKSSYLLRYVKINPSQVKLN